MLTPAWILDAFAAVMLAVAAVSAARVAAARPWRHGATVGDADIAHLLMAIAMSGMLTASLRTIPVAAWESVFSVMSAWFVVRAAGAVRARGLRALPGVHCVPCALHSAAMLYMFAALGGPPAEGPSMPMSGTVGMAGGMPTLHASTLGLIFALLLVAFTVHDLDRRAGVDGYFHVVGRRFVPGRSALTAAAAGPASGGGPVAHTAERLLLSPAVVKGCRVATGVTTAFILIIMI